MWAASFKSLYPKRPRSTYKCALLSGGRSRYSTKTSHYQSNVSKCIGDYAQIETS
jgi:hypothetical protein